MTLHAIATDDAPLPAGHYAQAICANGFVFVSGLLPIVPRSDRQIPEGAQAQAEQVFANLGAILRAAGTEIDRVASVQIFIPNIQIWDKVNDAYAAFFGAHKPARTIVPCGPLRHGVFLEANAVAVL